MTDPDMANLNWGQRSSLGSAKESAITNEPVHILLVTRTEHRFDFEAAVFGPDETLVVANSREEALQRVSETDFAAILLDIEMLGASGMELSTLIRDRLPNAFLIFLNVDNRFPLDAAYGLGAVDHLAKPISLVVLKAKLTQILKLVRLEREASHAKTEVHEELVAARQTLRALMAHIPEGVVIAGGPPNFNLEQASRHGLAMVGLDATGDDLLGLRAGSHMSAWHLHRPDGSPLPSDESPMVQAINGAIIVNQEVLIRRGDGRDVPILVNAAPVRDQNGDIVGAINCWRDISDLKASERALTEARRRISAALQAGEVGTYYWDMLIDKVTGDRNFATIFGVLSDARPSAPIGEFFAAIHPEDRERVGAEVRRTLEADRPFRTEYRINGPAGERWVLARGAVERNSEGTAIGWAGVLVDITGRKQIEWALAESEERFRSLFESMDEGYCVIEPVFDAKDQAVDYRYLLANPALTKHTGMVNIVGKTARELMPSHESHWIEAYAKVAATGEPIRKTEKVQDLGRWYDVSAFRVGPPDGHQVGVLFTDITDRKQAETLLREKDERLQLLIDRARDYAVVVTDRDGNVIEWSGGAEGITGIAPADILGRPADIMFTEEDREAKIPEKEMAQAVREGRAEDKRWHVRKDGSQFFADGVMVPLRDDDGDLHGFGKVFRDVTARKRAEDSVQFLADASVSLAELVDYESTLHRIANLAVGGFADWCVVDLLDAEGNRERLAVTTTESIAISAARKADAMSRAGSATMVPHVLRTGEPEVVFDLAEVDVYTSPQGPDRLTALRDLGIRSFLCVPLISRGQVIGGMTFLSSSTRRRFGPDELRVAQNLAERVTIAIENARLYHALQDQDRRKDEFLATLAHELRNPLAPIRNGLGILRTASTNAEIAGQTLSMMERQLGHITHLVDDLMDMARVSSGKVALRIERVSLRAVLDAAVETCRQAIESSGHELVLGMPTVSLEVDGDRTRLVQVVANLLNNAAKYTPHGGRITLNAQQDHGQAVIQVTDTGIGIPSEMLPKVFEMFTQVGASLERSQGGLGIGLTLVKRLIEMHGGTVGAESQGPGKGSTFTVRIPLAADEARLDDEESNGSLVPSDHLFDILVVDDNRDSAESLAMLLKIWGHSVKIAYDGPEALRVLANFRPRLVLLDLGLPGMNGYEVAHHIRQSSELRDVTLAALTGWGQEEDRRRTRDAGFDYHLVKPADPDELERIIRGIHPRK